MNSLLTSLECDLALFASLAARVSDHDPEVPSCPGWTATDLITHMATFHTLVAQWVTDGHRPDEWQRRPAPGQSLQAWARSCSDRLLEAVGTVDPRTPCSTWSPYDQTVGFWVRRMAHETLVHRVDLEQSLGLRWFVDPVIAADGIDEALTLWLPGRMPRGLTGSGRTVRVHAYGPQDNVLFDQVVRPYGELVHFCPYEAGMPVDAALSGPAAAVWACCWGRTDATQPVDVTGDADAVTDLRQILAAAEQ